MPSEQLAVPDQPQDIPSGPQVKICSSCHSALPFILSTAEPLVCAICRERPADPAAHRQFRIDQDAPYAHRPSLALDVPILLSSRRPQQDSAAYDNVLASTSSDTYHPSPIPPASYPKKPVLSNIQCNISPVSTAHRQPAHFSAQQQQQQQHSIATADPLADITRLRIRSRPHHCLYPGATFQGTQKSGRNSYDVNVTIVDVNFALSNLCGYLRIRGLTDDWPELTTYFDAEIIGSRYDLVHWSRFPAFKHIRHEAKRPHMTLDDRDRGVVFMRWKEGFYYVCVDFNPPTASSPTEEVIDESFETPLTPESDDSHPFFHRRIRTKSRSRTRRDSSTRRRGPPLAPINPPVATMSGFYYHQNSEPYQQLSLAHVPEQTSSSFEFR
ncbi:vacuolar import and degradation protein-domain-containing protein [Pholiota molesta]|nr:vacuolar import and degradation protein-domain-containing protein [Pholiota molesta]